MVRRWVHVCLAEYVANILTVQARNMVTEVDHPSCGPMKLVSPPVKYSSSETSIKTPPPTLGQHTDEVLKSLLGMDQEQINELRSKGVVA